MSVHTIFSKRLSKLLYTHRGSLIEAARRTGYSQAHLSNLARGRNVNPTIGCVWDIAQAFNVDPFWLLGQGTEQEAPQWREC